MKAPKITGIELKIVTNISYQSKTINTDWEAAGFGNLRTFYTEHQFEFKTPEGYLLKVPANDGLYRSLYEDIIFPDTIIEEEVTTEVVDKVITDYLSTWNKHPEEYYCIARNYIKFTWLFERFFWRPYLLLYGDWGTGKSEFGSYITRLCQNGLIMTDISAPSLARLLDMTNSVVMLDEMEKLDRPDAEKMNTILRNGYRYNGSYVVAEQETKKFAPSSYLVDQPKIIVRRQIPKDDALLSRVIPFRMIPRDREIPDAMRRSDERTWHEQRNQRPAQRYRAPRKRLTSRRRPTRVPSSSSTRRQEDNKRPPDNGRFFVGLFLCGQRFE